MEYRESRQEQQFRQEAREWLRTNKPKERRPPDDSFADQAAYDRAWQRARHEGGWAGVHWPKEYGGRGASPIEQLIWCEEYASARCPSVNDSIWLGVNHAGPTLIARGTEEQKRYHLPRILNADTAWCQGFSEPGAGSDLTGLRTTGVVDGDELVVTGQKTWTTYAHLADFMELLVRTGAPDSRHRGLTWAICDMKTPGVEARPIKALHGQYHNCEVFLDEARIPLSNVVGEIDGGWTVAMTTLNLERGPASFGNVCELVVHVEELLEYARTHPAPTGADTVLDSQAYADRLGEARARLQSLRALIYLMIEADQRELELGAEGSIMHLPFSEAMQSVYRLALEVVGRSSVSRRALDPWDHRYLDAFCATIAGGTSEIHRNIIGERLLGLPR